MRLMNAKHTFLAYCKGTERNISDVNYFQVFVNFMQNFKE